MLVVSTNTETVTSYCKQFWVTIEEIFTEIEITRKNMTIMV
jgi:hypothetical protein